MKPELLEILRCPVCKGELTLEARTRDAREVLSGNLRCAKCRTDYPIEDGIPDLLPPDQRE